MLTTCFKWFFMTTNLGAVASVYQAITRNTRLAPNILKVCLSVRQLRLDSAHRDRNYCCLFTLHESIYNKTYQTPRNRSSFHAYVWKIN